MEIFKSFPFDTSLSPIHISQGFNGPWSHHKFSERKLDLTYSVDFALPVNTVIKAVKDGIVTCVRDSSDSYYEGLDPEIGMQYGIKCNFIGVRDIDSKKETNYVHLAKESAKVKVGDKITRGHEIALSGKSGWIGETPHLHFQYSVFEVFKGRKTLPFGFQDFSKSLEHNQ